MSRTEHGKIKTTAWHYHPHGFPLVKNSNWILISNLHVPVCHTHANPKRWKTQRGSYGALFGKAQSTASIRIGPSHCCNTPKGHSRLFTTPNLALQIKLLSRAVTVDIVRIIYANSAIEASHRILIVNDGKNYSRQEEKIHEDWFG